MTLSNLLKTAGIAGLIGLGASAAVSNPASADTFRRCDSDGCYTVHCDWRGYCERESSYYDYYRPSYYAPRYYGGYYHSVRICDQWGCRYVRRYEPRSQVEFGFRF